MCLVHQRDYGCVEDDCWFTREITGRGCVVGSPERLRVEDVLLVHQRDYGCVEDVLLVHQRDYGCVEDVLLVHQRDYG